MSRRRVLNEKQKLDLIRMAFNFRNEESGETSESRVVTIKQVVGEGRVDQKPHTFVRDEGGLVWAIPSFTHGFRGTAAPGMRLKFTWTRKIRIERSETQVSVV